MFNYTTIDLARECGTDWITIQDYMSELGLLEYNNSIGEYDGVPESRPLREVRDFKIYWNDDVLEMLKLRIA
jgi:hypothetical protein